MTTISRKLNFSSLLICTMLAMVTGLCGCQREEPQEETPPFTEDDTTPDENELGNPPVVELPSTTKTNDQSNQGSGLGTSASQTGARRSYVANGLGVALGGRDLSKTLDKTRDSPKPNSDFAREIAEARRQFWAEFPDGDNLPAAQKNLAGMLFAKDIFTLILFLPEGPYSERLQTLSRTSGDLDGGLRALARDDFYRWVIAVREELGAKDHQGKNPALVMPWKVANLPLAIAATADDYDAYRMKRDWWEFQVAGHEKDFYPTSRDYMLYLIRLSDEEPSMEKAEEIYAQMAKSIGEDRMLAAAEKLRQAPKNERGTVENFEQLFTSIAAGTSGLQNEVFRKLVGQEDLVGYALYLDVQTRKGSWDEARTNLDQWFAVYGKEPVLAKIDQIRKAKKLTRSEMKTEQRGDRFLTVPVPGTSYTREDYLEDWEANGFKDQSSWGSLRDLVRKLNVVDPQALEKMRPKGVVQAEVFQLELPDKSRLSLGGSGIAVDGGRLMAYVRYKNDEGYTADARIFDQATGKSIQTLSFPIEHPAMVFGGAQPTLALKGDIAVVGIPGKSELIKDEKTGRPEKHTDVGVAHVFNTKNGDLLYSLRPNLTSPYGDQEFATCIDIQDGVLLIGSKGDEYTLRVGNERQKKTTSAVNLFDLTTGELLHTLQAPNPLETSRFGTSARIANNRVVVAAFTGEYRNYQLVAFVYDLKSGKLERTISGGKIKEILPRVDVSGDLAVLHSRTDSQKTFNLETGEVVADSLSAHKDVALEKIYGIGNGILIAHDAKRGLQLADVESWKKVAAIHRDGLRPEFFLTDLVSASFDGDACWFCNSDQIFRVDLSDVLSQ